MFLRTITIKGVTRLYFYESYYENGKTKQKCIENLGRLDELQKQFDDPVSHFKKAAKERTHEKKSSRKASVTIDLASSMDTKEDNLKNAGYAVIKNLYKQPALDRFWYSSQVDTKINGKPIGSRLPAFYLHVVYSSELAKEKNFNITVEEKDIVRSVEPAVSHKDNAPAVKLAFYTVYDGAHMDFFRFVSREEVKGQNPRPS